MAETDQKTEQEKAAAAGQRPESNAASVAETMAAAEAAIGEGAASEVVATAERLAAAEAAERLAAAEAEAARLKNDYLRALAEMENVRRRAARDRQEASQYAVADFARDLLSVADNLSRALASVDADARAKDPALDALTSGVEMTDKELQGVLERHGVKPIDALGQPFDPHVHEALYEVPDPSVPHGTVVQVAQAGYLLHDRTLRPARVGIARGGPKRGTPPAAGLDTEQPSVLSEDDRVIEFPTRGAGEPYRPSSEGTAPGTRPGTRIDEQH
jgi:molecular chaperone GrpE